MKYDLLFPVLERKIDNLKLYNVLGVFLYYEPHIKVYLKKEWRKTGKYLMKEMR